MAVFGDMIVVAQMQSPMITEATTAMMTRLNCQLSRHQSDGLRPVV
ncbi:hypothetical protein ACI2KT_20495 [Ensifer adhaerens]|jgi:hypothetical protein|nr:MULTISPECIES: hypothetical protein [unclassified Ensifer]